jgi:hypothetical protein
LSQVEPWAAQRLTILAVGVGQPVRALDFSADRLAAVLDDLSADEPGAGVEQALNAQTLRVYNLQPQRVRIDSTTAKSYGTLTPEGVWQLGPSAFSGNLLGNSEGFLRRTAEVSIDALHQFGRCQQASGFDHGPFAMDPMRLQGIEPRAFDGQGTSDNPDALACAFDALVVVAEPLPHGLTTVPRGIIPYQHQRRFAPGGQFGTDPG